MSLLFSQVKITANSETNEFLIGGIPREFDDLENWSEFEDFMAYIQEETEVQVHAEAYLYGDGETEKASEDEIKELKRKIDADSDFLNGYADNIEDVDFSFTRMPEELFDEDFEDDEEMLGM